MKMRQDNKDNSFRKNSYRQGTKPTYYTPREEQKPSYNYIEQTKIRIVQENLISVNGLPSTFDDANLLVSNSYFGKYGSVNKVIISSQNKYRSPVIQVYITYDSDLDASFAIKAIDGIKIQGKQVTATFGTTKYCTYFLRQTECRNDNCFYLHNYDTKNELVDGVKNNLDFLDQKAEKTINKNLIYFISKQLQEKNNKIQQNQFPSIQQTLQYLIEEGIVDLEKYEQVKKEIQKQSKNKNKELDSCQSMKIQKKKSQTLKNAQKQSLIKIGKEQIVPVLQIIQKIQQQKTKNEIVAQKQKVKNIEQKDQNNRANQKQTILQNQNHHISVSADKFQQPQSKNRKCNSLSTNPSPTKSIKNQDDIQEGQSIDKAIQKRIIKQIMKNKLVFKSKMQFATSAGNIVNNAKQESNRMRNYVRKHLLNQC